MKIKLILSSLILLILVSCSTSNDVASNRLIQKRKYNKGFFIDKNKTNKGLKKNESSPVVIFQGEEEMVNETKAINESKTEEIVSVSKFIKNEDIEVEGGETYNQSKGNQLTVVDGVEQADGTIIDDVEEVNQVVEKLDDGVEEEERTDDEKKIIGLILCLLGLAPFGVLVVLGKGPEYRKSLISWIIGYVLTLISMILILIAFYSELIIALIIAGWALAFVSIIILLVVLIKALILILK